jgi:DnaJ family protein C protein 19
VDRRRPLHLAGLVLSDEAEARAILGLDRGADADAIRTAHRRLVASVHPDRGGSADLARRVNAARDLLLKRL